MYLLSENQQLKNTTEKVMDDNRQDQANHDNGSSPFKFGK